LFTVYIHTNKINSKTYIGITSRTPRKRWGNNGNGYKNNKYFYSAIQKYDWNNFEHEVVLVNLTKEQAEMFEIEMIKYYKSNQREFGYNIASGGKHGNCGYIPTEESRRKISESNMKPVICLETGGIYKLVKDCAKDINIGARCISSVCCGNQKSTHGLHFMYLSDYDENKEYVFEEPKKVICIDTGIVYNSVTECAKSLNLFKENLVKVCKHKRKHVNGLRFCYLNEYSNIDLTLYKIKDRIGENNTMYGKGKRIVCLENLKTYNTIRESSKDLNLCASSIAKVCKHERKTCGRLHFIYYEEYMEMEK